MCVEISTRGLFRFLPTSEIQVRGMAFEPTSSWSSASGLAAGQLRRVTLKYVYFPGVRPFKTNYEMKQVCTLWGQAFAIPQWSTLVAPLLL